MTKIAPGTGRHACPYCGGWKHASAKACVGHADLPRLESK